MVQLSHLEFLPPCGDAAGRTAPPTILAIRSHLPGSTSHYNQDVHTTVDRWEVREKPQAIHPAFEQLSSRRNSAGSQPGVSQLAKFLKHESHFFQSVVYLKKLESFTVNKIVIALENMNIGRVLFLAYADGSVEYRDRLTMTETFNDGDLERVWHLSQIGFSYPDDEHCMYLFLRSHARSNNVQAFKSHCLQATAL